MAALTSTPPAYACGCAPAGAPGLAWQAGPCPAGSFPVASPNNICRVTKPDGTDLAMGWLDGNTQTCYFPKQAWTADGKAVGFGGTLGMSQLCYASGADEAGRGALTACWRSAQPILAALCHNYTACCFLCLQVAAVSG